ncbi:hypothetical protein NQ318_004987 [Aromia moschata]|uniref:Uncharacterized protein n=1 Tax=Aromia moschata TaxID=1265417 RepID=A0AAV8XIV4_9CUCU|nr:hypothetical protein NQ318_004987 [Aromia moschata]
MNKGNGPIPTSQLFALINKDRCYGSVNRGNKLSINSASVDAASGLALHSVREAPRLSLRRRAIETEISKSHLQRIFKQNRILPFKPKFRHTLEEGDEAKRLDFCLEISNRVLNDVGFHKQILFSDESTFSTNGVVSSQHCRNDGNCMKGHWQQITVATV